MPACCLFLVFKHCLFSTSFHTDRPTCGAIYPPLPDMDFEYSPHRSAGGTLHLLSPSHPQYSIDAFPAIKQLRRSLSRSPSKPSRFQLYTNTTTTTSPHKHSPNKPHSPSGLSRAFSANAVTENASLKNKFHLRRNAPIRANARKTSPNNTLRRALSDGVSQGNTTTHPNIPHISHRDQENHLGPDTDNPSDVRFELDNEPIKFDLLKARADMSNSMSVAMRDHMGPVPGKSSPLKRSDGVMNLDQASVGSPMAKRRSLHGAAMFGHDFDIFDQGLFDGSTLMNTAVEDGDTPMGSSARPRSPQKRAFNLRRSTLQHRATTGSARARLFQDNYSCDAPSSPSVPRTRSRMSLDAGRLSLDGALPLRGLDPLPFLSAAEAGPASRSAPRPHPLSKALSPSSSASSLGEDMNLGEDIAAPPAMNLGQDQAAPPTTVLKINPKHFRGFSKSLPVGALRPRPEDAPSDEHSNESFETPEAYKMAKPLPAAFMSTGLISKRNRNVDLQQDSFGSSLNMPDTPSKKTTMPFAGSPAPNSGLNKFARPQHEFGSPTTPWSPHAAKASPESFGKGVSIFGSKALANRRTSFLSINNDNENDEDDFSKSPSGSPHLDVIPPTDDMPPTPTKASTGPTTIRPSSKGKGNSLRSSLFGRRTSLAVSTFVAPSADDMVVEPPPEMDSKSLKVSHSTSDSERDNKPVNIQRPTTPNFSITSCGSPSEISFPSFMETRRQSQARPCPSPLPLRPRGFAMSFTSTSSAEAEHAALYGTPTDMPHTPIDSFTPPDPSGLTISGEHRGTALFNLSVNGTSFPPATPTGPRDNGNFPTINLPGASLSGYFGNDVDTTLTARFSSVQPIGHGEFSTVYRVEKPIPGSPAAKRLVRSKVGNVWAVKKSKKPYLGQKDRERKLREVQILQSLRGNEHIIDLSDSWESKGHLYIQTEFCENGNLKDFLTQTGFKGRLDDFRIWKILLELCQVGYGIFSTTRDMTNTCSTGR